MKQAIIDIGSNSMRLTLYEVEGESFKIVFKDKIMAGLAGYVENGVLSSEGIECAYNGLLNFRETLESLDISNVAVFATASLRNIVNTDEAITAIHVATGYSVEVISGEEEALLGYLGALREVHVESGAFVDVGGASTEVVLFDEDEIFASSSFQIGALSLYKECVKKIMPGEGAMKRMKKVIKAKIDEKASVAFDERPSLVCVGGTSRAILKFAKKLYSLPEGHRTVSADQLDHICSMLYEGGQNVVDLILKLEPDRIHTIVPGAMIMQHVFKLFNSEEMIVSKYGVREGYLCRMISRTSGKNMHTLKIGS